MKVMKALHRKVPGFRQTAVELLAKQLRMPEQRIWERLQKPWALRQLLLGEWVEIEEAEEAVEAEVEARLRNALELNYLLGLGVPIRRVTETLSRVRDEYEQEQKNKQEVITPSPPRSGLEEEDGRRTEA